MSRRGPVDGHVNEWRSRTIPYPGVASAVYAGLWETDRLLANHYRYLTMSPELDSRRRLT